MTARRIVIGAGPDALRAAAVLARAGHSVTLLQESATASGLSHPELPVGTGRLRPSPGERALVESVVGPLVDAPDAMRGIVIRGKVHRLPMSPAEVGRLMAPAVAATAARSWTRARARNELARLFGGGQEERSHKDWVVRRMGEPAWNHLYRAYVENRFGAPSDVLSVSVARRFHGLRDDAPYTVAGGGTDEALAFAARVVADAGGEIRTGARVDHLRVAPIDKEDRVVAVVMADGEEIAVEDPKESLVWIARSPAVVSGWLGDAWTKALHSDAAQLVSRDAVQIAMEGETDGLPDELSVLDEGAPFYRVVTPYGTKKTAIFHTSLLAGRPLPPAADLVERVAQAARALGVGDFGKLGTIGRSDASVERIADWNPVWQGLCHARLRNVLLSYSALGIVAVGRSGCFAHLDPGEEIHVAHAYATAAVPEQHELHRVFIDPPVRQDDLFAPITRFVER